MGHDANNAGPPILRSEQRNVEAVEWTGKTAGELEEQTALGQLASMLTAAGADSEEFRTNYLSLATILMEIALPVVKGKIQNGDILNLARQSKRPMPAEFSLRSLSQMQLDDLATDTVMAGNRLFKRSGIHRWSPDGGASITTWFITGCWLEFPRVAERFIKSKLLAEATLAILMPQAIEEYRLSTYSDDVAKIVIQRERIRAHLQGVDPAIVYALFSISEGATQAEAARKHDVPLRTLQRFISRSKQNVDSDGWPKPESENGGNHR